MIAPVALRREIVDRAHEGHPGIHRTLQNVRSMFWWPNLAAEVRNHLLPCEPCQYSQKSTPAYREPPRSLPTPTKPWERIAIDVHGPYGHAPGHQRFMVMLMHHFSGWVEYLLCGETSSATIIRWLKGIFSRYGLCDELVSDNGSNLVSQEFENFLSACGIKHLRSPVYHPQGNG